MEPIHATVSTGTSWTAFKQVWPSETDNVLAINKLTHHCQTLASAVLIRLTLSSQFNALPDNLLRSTAMDADLTVLVYKTLLLLVLNATVGTSLIHQLLYKATILLTAWTLVHVLTAISLTLELLDASAVPITTNGRQWTQFAIPTVLTIRTASVEIRQPLQTQPNNKWEMWLSFRMWLVDVLAARVRSVLELLKTATATGLTPMLATIPRASAHSNLNWMTVAGPTQLTSLNAWQSLLLDRTLNSIKTSP
jgi:hypothetical protein